MLDLSSACDSILLIFLSSHSESLTFFSILCRKSSMRLRSDLNRCPSVVLALLLDLCVSPVYMGDFDFDLGFDFDFDFSLLERSLLDSLAPFRFPRWLCFESFACLDSFPLRLDDADGISSLDFDAFIRRGKYVTNSAARPSSSRRISTFCASDLRT